MENTDSIDMLDDDVLQQNITEKKEQKAQMKKEWKKGELKREVDMGERRPSFFKRLLLFPIKLVKLALVILIGQAIMYVSTGYGMPGADIERINTQKEIRAIEVAIEARQQRMNEIDFSKLRDSSNISAKNAAHREYASLVTEQSAEQEKLLALQDAYNAMIDIDNTFQKRFDILLERYQTFFAGLMQTEEVTDEVSSLSLRAHV